MKTKHLLSHKYTTLLKSLLFLITSLYLVIACSSDNKNEDESEDVIYLNIPDVEFEKKLINLGIDSDNEINHRMLKVDAGEVSSIDLSSFNANKISDLTGIEGFINLKRLYAGGNNLTAIDLKSNTQLDTLVLSSNNIKSIDIGNNTELIKLNLSVNNLSSITGLSKAIKLKWLSLSTNVLEELSVQNATLTTLFIRDNHITTLDTQGAVNLTTILAQINRISKLDLSTNILLETVALSDNKIKSINLEKNTDIHTLHFSSNLLTEFDVSNLQKLIFLTIDRNPNLFCIKIGHEQNIPNLTKADYQELNTNCN
ncbi:hypothetical protein ATE84_4021 [Aquimarina sp. MAR_2010_214]|uniref:leucine-rich repeat domain-containing protein n=1 Tax=Aquimarina sp. MAR_2010_214 TaxID=1250026 RepID=UPI000C7019A2|nr:hypothetical protein [Aquimarina sp. MAR_2010_214]PKV51921.1 hypothetical protein ATE84_4021 [Aquimarina sp. MAR_2010_214]